MGVSESALLDALANGPVLFFRNKGIRGARQLVCHDAARWALGFATEQQAWDACDRPEWMMRWLELPRPAEHARLAADFDARSRPTGSAADIAAFDDYAAIERQRERAVHTEAVYSLADAASDAFRRWMCVHIRAVVPACPSAAEVDALIPPRVPIPCTRVFEEPHGYPMGFSMA